MKRLLVFFWGVVPLSLSAQVITTAAGTGTAGYSGDGGPAISAQFNYPTQVTFDKYGNLFVADENNNVIRKLDTTGIITTIAGDGTFGYNGDGGTAITAKLNTPTDVAIDDSGNIYISDLGNNVIRKVNSSGIISTFVGNGIAGYTGDGGPALYAELHDPYALTFDDSGDLYITDNGNYCIRKVNKFGIVTTVAGGGSNTGDGIPAIDAKLGIAGFIAISTSEELYIPDWTHHRIRKVDKRGIITTFAGNGIAGNTGDGGLAIDAELNAPNCVRIDKDGNLYLSDNFANVVRKVNTSGIISTIAGNGTTGYSGDGGAAIDAEFNDPNGAVVGPDGNMYIADVNNNVIRKVTLSTDVNSVTKSKPTISIYPNPSINEVNISSSDKAIKTIQIINTLGQTLFSHTYNTNEITLDISALPKGFYVIKINNEYNNRLVKI